MDLENEQAEASSRFEREDISSEQEKSPAEIRQERLARINEELEKQNQKAVLPEEIQEMTNQRDAEYQNKLEEFGALNLDDERKGLIRERMVNEVIGSARKENKRFGELQKEKKKLTLYNNLELGEEAQESIDKARRAIEAQDDMGGEKIKMFEAAIEYYSRPQEKIAEIPISHGTSSFYLHKIIKLGALDSSKSIFGSEKIQTMKSHGGTSFALGGYEESEIVSHLYARMNAKETGLLLDSKSIFGDAVASGEEIIDLMERQLPKLKPDERIFVEAELKKINIERIKKLFNETKYYFNYDAVRKELQESEEKFAGKMGTIVGSEYIAYLKERIPHLEGIVEGYARLSDSERGLISNPYGVVLAYEGKGLPKKRSRYFHDGRHL